MDFAGITFDSVPEIVAGITVAMVAIALGLRKLHAMYAADGVSIAKVNSELDIITLLREQIKELANANKELRRELEGLRQLNRSLTDQTDDARAETRDLHDQLRTLAGPAGKLRRPARESPPTSDTVDESG